MEVTEYPELKLLSHASSIFETFQENPVKAFGWFKTEQKSI